MSTSTDLATRPAAVATRRDPVPSSYAEAMAVGATLAKSGFFTDARDGSQAAAKVIAGMELGIGPMAAMAGIYIVKGKVTLGSNLIGGQVKRSGRYDFKVTRLDDEGCVIDFYDRGEKIGTSSFTKADAEAAGLWGSSTPWKQHTRNMLYARAMSNGAKWYTPDIFAGPVYTPDELGATVDGETGEVIDLPGSRSPIMPTGREYYDGFVADYGEDAVRAAAKAAGASSSADFADDTIRERVAAVLDPAPADDDDDEPISEPQRKRLEAIARELGRDHDWMSALAGEAGYASSTEITRDQYEHFEQMMRDTAAAEDAA